MDAGGAVDYAWEEPLFAHRLRICIDSDAVAYKDNVYHEYNLDVIKVRALPCSACDGWERCCCECSLGSRHNFYAQQLLQAAIAQAVISVYSAHLHLKQSALAADLAH